MKFEAPRGADRARADELVEREERLLLRDVRVEVVGQVERDAVDAEPAKARLHLPADPAAAQAPGRRPSLIGLNVFVAITTSSRTVAPLRPEPLADPGLAAPATVRVGGVERADAELPRLVEQPERVVAARPLAEERRCGADPAEVPAAEDDSA